MPVAGNGAFGVSKVFHAKKLRRVSCPAMAWLSFEIYFRLFNRFSIISSS